MSQRKRVIATCALLTIVVISVGGIIWMRRLLPNARTQAVIGSPLPPAVVYDASGRPAALPRIAAGRRRVFVFYSPSCDVCKRELPQLHPFPAELTLVRISEVKGAGDYEDRDGVLMRTVSMPSLPTLLFVDEQGVLRDGLVGAHEHGVTQKRLQAFARSRS